jgi:ATP-dependent helicase/nuclease subunit A
LSLSDKQLAAAHRLGQDVCVVAGPGSGKTSVLIERFCWLVRDCAIDPGKILAITFTEKAATEIKERLVKQFANELETREKIERAYVSTIHSFCTRLLRENALTAGLDPQFTVADGGLSATLLRETADEVLEDLYQSQHDLMCRFMRSLAVAPDPGGFIPDLAQSLIAIYESVRTAGVELNEQAFELTTEEHYGPFRALLQQMLADHPRPKSDKQIETHDRLRNWATEFLALPRKVSADHFRLLNEPQFHKGTMVKTSVAYLKQDELRAVLPLLRAQLLLEYYAAERKLVIHALQEIDRVYRQRKRARSLVDFSDLEEFTIALLESDSRLMSRMRDGFEYILMDELQDTNPLQWKLLNLVRRPDRFFAVGDVNQSIFGFRFAEPQLFHAYRDQLASEGKEIDELRANYRSRPELLSAVNTTFSADKGIDPHSLSAARDFAGKDLPSIEVMVAGGESTLIAEQNECLWIGRRISEVVDRLMVNGREGEHVASFADIAVLARTNAIMAEVQSALDRYGIPSVVVGGRTFFETREIKDLRLLLAAIANPRDEVALAGVLRSPLVSASDETLMRLRQAGRPLIEAVATSDDPSLVAFHKRLTDLRPWRDTLTADRLLQPFIDDSDYERGLTDRGRANVEKFLSLIRVKSDAETVGGILDEIEDSAPEAEAPPVDYGNTVRLMSIHRSKGLEFPIVFVPSLHTGGRVNTPVVCFSHQCGLGIKWRDPWSRDGCGDTAYNAIRNRQKGTQGAEDSRLLYVAMTRAQDHMVLSFALTQRPVGKWYGQICRQLLGVDSKQIANESSHENRSGVRLLVSAAPPEITSVATQSEDAKSEILLEPPIANGQYDSTISATAVSLFDSCPRKYYLSRYLKIGASPRNFAIDDDREDTEDRDEIDAAEFGVQVHSLLAGQVVEGAASEALELAGRFRSSSLGREAESATHSEREFDFLIAIDDVVVRGQIDLWYERVGEITIVDYKTDQVTSAIDPDRIASYGLQLQIYALALEKLMGEPVRRAYLYFLRPNQVVEVDLSPLQLEAAREAVRRLRAAQNSLEFPLREGEHCRRCEFYEGACPAVVPKVLTAASAPPSSSAALP